MSSAFGYSLEAALVVGYFEKGTTNAKSATRVRGHFVRSKVVPRNKDPYFKNRISLRHRRLLIIAPPGPDTRLGYLYQNSHEFEWSAGFNTG